MITSSTKTNRQQTVEEQRAALQSQLTLRPDDPYLRQSLLRLSSPQHIKTAARDGIFVSYAGADEMFAMQLAEDMRSARLSVWLDVIDISNDGDWRYEVNAALDRCGLMVTILSSHALMDEDLRAENTYFAKQGKIVVPVVYQHCKVEGSNLWSRPVDFRHDYTLGLSILVRLLSSQTAMLNH
jgi:hypothetical protein